jgi:hypothetical protein
MRKLAVLAVIYAWTLLPGCASVTPAGEGVRFAKSEDDVFGCVDKGPVSARGMGSMNDAQNAIRNRAAEAGANVIQVTRERCLLGEHRG